MINGWYMLGMLGGVVVGILVAVILTRLLRGRWAFFCAKKNYDERQYRARGKAFRDGFWTLLGCEVLGALVIRWNDWALTAEITILLGCFLGLTVFLVSCIFRDAYLGIHDRWGRWTVAMVVLGVLNLWLGLLPGLEGNEIHWLNFFCGLLCLVGVIALLLKAGLDRREGDGEEE